MTEGPESVYEVYPLRLEAVADRYVEPFYEGMFQGRFMELDPSARASWLRGLHATADALDEQTAGWFLDYPEWRGRMAVSWMIGLRGWNSFAEQLGRLLVQSDLISCGQGYCIGLALLGTKKAADMLVAHLDEWLPRTDCRRSEQEWAMAALIEIDSRGNTSRSGLYLDPGGPWDEWRNADPAEPTPLAPVGVILDLLVAS